MSCFALYVWDEEGRSDWAFLTIPLACPDAWFFEPDPDECPAGPPLYSAGAQERFERGVMLWVQGEDRIYVLYDDGGTVAWDAFTDEWDEGEPERSCDVGRRRRGPTSPSAASAGSGARGAVRQRLGWATGPEQGYGTAVQRSARDLYIRAADNGTWRLGPEGREWAYIRRR